MAAKTLIENLASIENKIRPTITKIFPYQISSFIYSLSRKLFINYLANARFEETSLQETTKIRLWDIDFNCGIFNAAGMFKNGEGYYTCAKMGAGAYLAGTTTASPRLGNKKWFIKHPFLPYPLSNVSSNWMGLPNKGHQFVAVELSKLQKINNCPIGASIAEDPESTNALMNWNELVNGMKLYDKAGVDFIELNLSCPNVPHNSNNNTADNSQSIMNCGCSQISDTNKLIYIAENFLKKRIRPLPLIVKYSNDIDTQSLFQIIDLLIDLGFDGINLGNTSTQYVLYKPLLIGNDKRLYDKFTSQIGGGLSGNILKERSLYLCKLVNEYLKTKPLTKEFHCIRTGGISSFEDITQSNENGIMLNQWFVGFFECFANSGFNTYKRIFNADNN